MALLQGINPPLEALLLVETCLAISEKSSPLLIFFIAFSASLRFLTNICCTKSSGSRDANDSSVAKKDSNSFSVIDISEPTLPL